MHKLIRFKFKISFLKVWVGRHWAWDYIYCLTCQITVNQSILKIDAYIPKLLLNSYFLGISCLTLGLEFIALSLYCQFLYKYAFSGSLLRRVLSPGWNMVTFLLLINLRSGSLSVYRIVVFTRKEIYNQMPAVLWLFSAGDVITEDYWEDDITDWTLIWRLTFVQLTNSIYSVVKLLIIHEENTKEIMTVKEFVYLIQNHADLYKL
jgi:hypothetical protein